MPPVVLTERCSDNRNGGFMSRITKQLFSMLFAILMFGVFAGSAAASVGGGSTVGITYTGQTADTITFDGVRVEAKYSPGGGYGSSEYSCAALVMKFYKQVYGFDVWNLSSPGSIPTCSNGASFSLTDTPRVGDIVRFQDRTHWALVKSVKGSTVTIIEQNWGYHSGSGYVAAVNRTVEVGDAQVSFLTYSDYGYTLAAQEKANEQAMQAEEVTTWEEVLEQTIPAEQRLSIESEDNLKAVAADNAVENAMKNSIA
ncbi:MAG: CHAP domain-containing protein [Ruminococcaceae bacterium]|nr:CHAP domain-containing protein [Oscillospiraceae bacterium]